MHPLRALACTSLVFTALACTAISGVDGLTLESAGAGAASAGASSGSGAGTGGDAPTTCAEADNGVGCCVSESVLYYCTTTATVFEKTCASGTVCGWSSSEGYYDCVAPPSSADPSMVHPLICGLPSGGSSSSSSSSSASSTSGSSTSTSSSSSSSSGGTVTWTELYDTIFGPTGTSNCSLGGGCHTNGQSGFTSGTTKSACYTGMVNYGLIVSGSNASSASQIVASGESPLCGTLGGNMPKTGSCVTSAQIAKIQDWLATGAPDN